MTGTEQPQTSAELEALLLDILAQCARLIFQLQNIEIGNYPAVADIEAALLAAGRAAGQVDAHLFAEPAEHGETVH
jgi:hypothetical protein